MIKTFVTSYRLSHAYGVNTLIYRLRALPIIKNILPQQLYAAGDLKLAASIVVAIFSWLNAVVGKFLYLGLMVLLPAMYLPGERAENYTIILFLFTIAGGFLNVNMFEPSKQKYYAVMLMRIDARRFALSNQLFFFVKCGVTFIPASLVIGYIGGVSIWINLLLPFFVVAVKCLFSFGILRLFEKTGYLISANNVKPIFLVAILSAVLSYGAAYVGIGIPNGGFIVTAVILILTGPVSFWYLWKSRIYKRMYKKLLSMNAVIFNTAETAIQMQQNTYQSKLTDEVVSTGGKSGYEYFNKIFIERHKKIVTNSAKKIAYILLVIVGILIFVIRLQSEIAGAVNQLLLTFLPYFVFVMYLMNRGRVITQVMFMNCDHSMLAYRFYREPDTIVRLFKVRLITLIKINMFPTMVIACGLPALLFAAGGTKNPLNYILLFVSIVAMSVFFSVHNLVLYYLLQPYNINMESKSSAYSIVCSLTYIVCYLFIRLRAPTVIFAGLVILFCILYIGVSLPLVYKYAPKRFRLK